MPQTYSRAVSLWLFTAGALAIAAAYWVGLRGPLLLDDLPNLSEVIAWIDGSRTWQSAILSNRSGMGGRPLSMASFVLDAALWGKDVWHFKLTNLVVHLLCGLVLWRVLLRLLPRDPALDRHAGWLALLLTLVWLSLPIQVSSVLYVVQRMAMLAALFMLLALWVYLVARTRLEQDQPWGVLLLWVVFPLLLLLGFLCKENAVLVAPMALVIELAYFRPPLGQRRKKSVRAFFFLSVGIPLLAIAGWLMLKPDWLPASYSGRDFTLSERLLTQPRILWDYVRSIFVPFGPALGLFHDNFPKSRSLFSPWTTLPAIVGWIALIVCAWRVRRLSPSILAGLALFLVGHAMESGALALELYFEHRNYLPAAGLLIAVAGGINALLQRMPDRTAAFKKVGIAFPIVVLLVYLGVTHGRARVWSSLATLYAQELRYNPDSPRLRSNLTALAMSAGDLDAALTHIAAAEKNGGSQDAATASLWRFMAYCASRSSPPEVLYLQYDARARGAVTMYAAIAWEQLVQKIERGECTGINVPRLSRITARWLDATFTREYAHQNWRMRYYLARSLAFESNFSEAIIQGQRSWHDSGYNTGVGVFLFQVNASAGRLEKCRTILASLEQSTGGGDLALDRAVAQLRIGLLEMEREQLIKPSSSLPRR